MIDQNGFIAKAENWYKQPLAVYGGDALLCAFVGLRIISTEILELVSPDLSSRHIHQSSETLFRLMNGNITRWEERWFPVADDGKSRTQPRLLLITP
jgi:hypothetical protein